MRPDPQPGVLVAHQPAYLPWHGYFARLLDPRQRVLLVLLDHVQFSERGRQHRNHIRAPRGGPLRLTVPIRRRFGQPITAARIADPAFAARHWRSIHESYRQARYWNTYADTLGRIYQRPWSHLADLDIALTEFMLDALDAPITLIRSSELAPAGAKTTMLIDLCRMLNARALRIGAGGSRHYLDATLIQSAGITVEVAEYTHPRYQQGPGPFTPGLAALDALLHCGPGTTGLLRRGLAIHRWNPAPS
jgi:WbqC-like protein family